jgi:hypothetical protein
MIDEAITRRAVEELTRAASKDWPCAEGEIQDGGTFLLLSVQVPPGANTELSPAKRSKIIRALNKVVPSSKQQSLGSWMVVVMRGGTVEQSILANEL